MTTARSASGAALFRRPSGGNRRRGLGWLAALLVLWLVAPTPASGKADLDDRARAVAAELRCPVCQNLSVADSSSELARDMRELIRAELAAGKTPDEIKAYFVSKYGDWILLSPRPRGLSLVLWGGPFAGAVVAAVVALRLARRWAHRPRAQPEGAPDPTLLERVRREALRDEAEDAQKDPEATSPLERERDGLYAALRELDFDHRAGKLSAADYAVIRAEYEARAAAVVAELDRAPAPAVPAATRVLESRAPSRPSARPGRAPRPWRLVAAGAFLVLFGLAVGYSLSRAVRPRLGEGQSITGDALTGTGPVGTAPARGASTSDLGRLLAAGRAAHDRGQWREAVDTFKQALALDPDNPEAHTFVGLVLFHAGHADEALRSLDRALARAPRHPLALWGKGLALYEAKQDYAGAIEVWETLMTIDLAPEDADQVARRLAEARTRLAAEPPEPTGARGR